MTHAEIRAAVRKLCEAYPGEYWRALDRERGYPAEFVAELTRAGFLAALIPQAYGGSGLPLSAAAAILEEIQASGCNGASCHAQMYVMGTLLRHGSEAQKQRYLPRIAIGRTPPAGLRGDGARQRHRHRLDHHHRAPRGRPLHHPWPEDLDEPGGAFRPDDPARPHRLPSKRA